MSSIKSPITSPNPSGTRVAHRIALASAALAGLLTLALVSESASASVRNFGGTPSFGGARAFSSMRAVNTRLMRVSTVRPNRMVGGNPVRISRTTGNRDRYPGKISRYPGNDRNPGKVASHGPGRWPPYRPGRPGRPIWHPPYPVVTPVVPLTLGPGTIVTTSVPPTINPVTSPPNGPGPGQTSQGGQAGQGGGFNPPPPGETRYVRNEALLHVAANISTPVFDAMLRRNRLTRLELLDFAMTGRRIARVRINDGRAVAQVIQSLRGQSLRGDVGVTGAQPNYLFALDQGDGPANDPTQYAYAKLNLSQAHAVVRGGSIRVAVIDSMIDTTHPDLTGAVAATFDATGAVTKPHFHGTGVAGVIAAHGKLTGSAPSVQILAATAFGAKDARGTGMDILKALDWAGKSRADIVNMSFTGPSDPEQHIELLALHRRGAVLVAAAGNGGPRSPALYPAADPDVIAVTATDSDDNLYAQANRGAYIAVAAPGVSILVASPGGSYALRSGTSFAAPQVSGVAALLLERNRKLDPVAIRSILTATARDLGPPGRDDQFGAGLVNAMSAVESAGMLSTEVSARSAQPGN